MRSFVFVFAAALAASLAMAQAVPQPSSGLMPNPAQGKRLFDKNCAACHGPALQGSDKGPPLRHPVYEPSHHGDASFQAAVRYGVRAHHWKFGDMPPIQGVSPDEVAHITAYVRQQQRLVGIR
jgi:mono/diheme cytochrome c family protein